MTQPPTIFFIVNAANVIAKIEKQHERFLSKLIRPSSNKKGKACVVN